MSGSTRERLARLVTLAILGSYAAYTILSFGLAALQTSGIPGDVTAYWTAAEGVRNGGGIYRSDDPDAFAVYRYAPWLAWLWTPFLALPIGTVAWTWAGLMVLAALAACIPAARLGSAGVALALLLGPGMVVAGLAGNVMPAVVCALAYLLPTRWGPIVVGVAASLKVAPLMLASGWIARRHWGKATAAAATSVVLWAPALRYDWWAYTVNVGSARESLFGLSPAIWALVSVCTLCVTAWLALRRSEWTWVAAVIAAVVIPPRTATGMESMLIAVVPMLAASAAPDRGFST